MELPLNIYVFQLESDNIFVYPTRRINPTFNELALEIALYYDFVKTYPAVRIIETLYDQVMMAVDSTVKKYMLFFDFSIVRGGTYYMEILPDYLQKSLNEELSFISLIDLPNIDFIENLVLLKDRTEDERTKLRGIFIEILAQYRKEKKQYEELRSYNIGTESYIIDENVLLRIQEIKQCILEEEPGSISIPAMNTEISELYPTFLIFLRRLLAIVLQYDSAIIQRSDITPMELVYLKNPEFILDTFFCGRNCPFWTAPAITDDHIRLAVKICEYYETICRKVLNMIDESVFDVGLYESDFEWKYERAIYYMDRLVKENYPSMSMNSEVGLTSDNK